VLRVGAQVTASHIPVDPELADESRYTKIAEGELGEWGAVGVVRQLP
jgi:hypothetical protein